jgi:hypothetical protein
VSQTKTNRGRCFLIIPDLAIGTHANGTSANISVTDVYCPSKPNSNTNGSPGMVELHPDLFWNHNNNNNDTDFDFDNNNNNNSLYGNSTTTDVFDQFMNPMTAPCYLFLLLPMISMKSPTFFTKFNSVGTINVFFLISVISYLGWNWGWNVDFVDTSSQFYVPMYKNSFPSLTGMMALGLFIHNAIITIMKNNRHQQNNVSTFDIFS